MKILMLTHEFPPFRGGIATYAGELAIAAQALGPKPTVVALNRSTIPEVLGESGVLVDEPTPESFARGLKEVLDTVHAGPQEVASRARSQAAQFRWDDAVKQTLEILERAA